METQKGWKCFISQVMACVHCLKCLNMNNACVLAYYLQIVSIFYSFPAFPK